MSIRPGLLSALLKSGHLHGAIRWKTEVDIEATKQEIEQFGFTYQFLDTAGVVSIEMFFDVANQQLKLSADEQLTISNFEKSLQALPNNSVVVWLGWQDFANQAPQDASMVADIFDEVAQSWSGAVLILGKSGNYPKVAELTAIA